MTKTNDLIDSLRRAEGSEVLPRVILGRWNAEVVCGKAADEIERLQALLKLAENALKITVTARDEGHTSANDLLMHFFEAVGPAQIALAGIYNLKGGV